VFLKRVEEEEDGADTAEEEYTRCDEEER